MRTATVEEIEQFITNAGSDSLGVFGGTHEGGIHIQQVPDELAPCISSILKSGKTVQSILEIGAAAGGTTFIFDCFFSPERIVLVDDNQHPKHSLRSDVLKDINRQEIIGNSRDNKVIEQVQGPFDIVIIDGDHSYEGVKADFDNYFPMLRQGGFLVLHDSATTVWGCAVSMLVAELKENEAVLFIDEFISGKGPKCGIALFQKVAE